MSKEPKEGQKAEDFKPVPKGEIPLCPVCGYQMRWNSARGRWECPADHYDRYYIS